MNSQRPLELLLGDLTFLDQDVAHPGVFQATALSPRARDGLAFLAVLAAVARAVWSIVFFVSQQTLPGGPDRVFGGGHGDYRVSGALDHAATGFGVCRIAHGYDEFAVFYAQGDRLTPHERLLADDGDQVRVNLFLR